MSTCVRLALQLRLALRIHVRVSFVQQSLSCVISCAICFHLASLSAGNGPRANQLKAC